jgi:hypothetical protein
MEFTICIAPSPTVGDDSFLLHDLLSPWTVDTYPTGQARASGIPDCPNQQYYMDWEFERKKKVTEYATKRFKRMLQKPVQLYEIRACLALPDLPSE